jgi:hypothetical protein
MTGFEGQEEAKPSAAELKANRTAELRAYIAREHAARVRDVRQEAPAPEIKLSHANMGSRRHMKAKRLRKVGRELRRLRAEDLKRGKESPGHFLPLCRVEPWRFYRRSSLWHRRQAGLELDA